MIETAQELICNLYKHCKVTTCHSFRVGNDLCGFGRYLGIENQGLNLLVTFITIKTWHYPIQISLKRRLTNSYYDIPISISMVREGNLLIKSNLN